MINHLRLKGLLLTIYIDNLLLMVGWGNSYKSCLHNTRKMIKLIEGLGLTINYRKCLLTPKKCCKNLRFVLDTENYTIELTDTKRDHVKCIQNKFENRYRIREIVQHSSIVLTGNRVQQCLLQETRTRKTLIITKYDKKNDSQTLRPKTLTDEKTTYSKSTQSKY